MTLEQNKSEASEKKWFYLDANNASQGPFPEYALKNFLNEQIIKADTFIWSDSISTWTKYEEIFNIPSSTIQTPPAPVMVASEYNSPSLENRTTNINSNNELKELLFGFTGRITRSQYWLTNLVLFIIIGIAFLILGAISEEFAVVVGVLSLIPLIWIGLALSIKRLHDINFSGWYVLLALIPYVGGIILLIFYLIPSNKTDNKYGPRPY